MVDLRNGSGVEELARLDLEENAGKILEREERSKKGYMIADSLKEKWVPNGDMKIEPEC